MALDPRLLAILVCPKCRSDLEYLEAEEQLRCPACRVIYRVEDDIPVLLIDEATAY